MATIPERFNVAQIRALAEDPAVSTVEEMLACLVRDLKLKSMLLHTSFAAQNSDSKNPRILLLSAEKREVDGIFSVNSGEMHLNQAQSIEFMFNDKNKKEIEFYDIDFSERRGVMSGANPESCMACHGVAGRVPLGGPKPLFDRDPWPRVVHAGSNFSPQADSTENSFCSNRRRLHTTLEEQTIRAFKSKRRYQSLVSLPKTDVEEIDLIVRDLNSRRIAKWIVGTPDYQEYKWAIFAAAYSCIENAADYFSPRQIAQMIKMDTLDVKAVQARDSAELDQFVFQKQVEQWKQSLQIDNQNVAIFDALKRDEAVVVGLPNFDTGGQCQKPFDRQAAAAQGSKPITVMDRFIRDSEANYGDYETGVFRYIFESRGMDISDWNTQPVASYGRGPGSLLRHLMELEPRNSPDYVQLKEAVSMMQFEACPRLRKLAKQNSFEH